MNRTDIPRAARRHGTAVTSGADTGSGRNQAARNREASRRHGDDDGERRVQEVVRRTVRPAAREGDGGQRQ
jgi:hypothetical protein